MSVEGCVGLRRAVASSRDEKGGEGEKVLIACDDNFMLVRKLAQPFPEVLKLRELPEGKQRRRKRRGTPQRDEVPFLLSLREALYSGIEKLFQGALQSSQDSLEVHRGPGACLCEIRPSAGLVTHCNDTYLLLGTRETDKATTIDRYVGHN